MIVVKDETTGCVAAHVCEQRRTADKWVVERVCDDFDLFGHSCAQRRWRASSTGSGAVRSSREKNAPNNLSEPASVQSSIQWAAERAVQEVMSQVRAMKVALDQRLGTTMKTDWKALERIVELSAVLINQSVFGGS